MRRVQYNSGDAILEFVVRDSSGAKMEVFRCNGKDTEEYGKMIMKIYAKFGYKPKLPNNFLDPSSEFFRI